MLCFVFLLSFVFVLIGLCFLPVLPFLPKVHSQFHCSQDIIFPAFFPNLSSEEEEMLHSLDICRALSIYLDRTSTFRKWDSLFITFGVPKNGCRPSASTLSRWVKSTIVKCYELSEASVPRQVQAKSTRGGAAS